MKVLTGKVVSNKQAKTVVAEVERFFRHPMYEKRMRRTKKYQVHTDQEIKLGETIRFVETRPISKDKRWRVVRRIES